MAIDELLTTQEVAKLLKINPGTLENWRRINKGPPFRYVGDLVRYPASELAAWVDGRGKGRRKSP
jgi:excisionase family DNA binding protein